MIMGGTKTQAQYSVKEKWRTILLEECLQRAAKSQFFLKGQRSQKVTTHYCPNL